jgi:hypothetical protein
MLAALPRAFALGDPSRTALRVQFIDVPSASLAELVVEPARGTAKLLAPKIPHPRSREFRDFAAESPLPGDLFVRAGDDRIVVEAVVPFGAFKNQSVQEGSLGLVMVAYDPTSRDPNIARGKGARRDAFHEPAVMGVSFSNARFTRRHGTGTPRREWHGTVIPCAPAERGLDASRWRAAMSESEESLSAELAVRKGLLEGVGIAVRDMRVKFRNGGRLADDAWAAVRDGGFRRVYPEPPSAEKPRRYRLVLHFAELSDVRPGERVFDVLVQGRRAIGDLDVVREAGGRYRAVSREVSGIEADASIRLEFQPKAGTLPPILNGIELLAD